MRLVNAGEVSKGFACSGWVRFCLAGKVRPSTVGCFMVGFSKLLQVWHGSVWKDEVWFEQVMQTWLVMLL